MASRVLFALLNGSEVLLRPEHVKIVEVNAKGRARLIVSTGDGTMDRLYDTVYNMGQIEKMLREYD